MRKSQCYINTSQIDAAEKTSVLTNQELDYAAYKQWTGLSDYASQNLQAQVHEDGVTEWMKKTRAEYQGFSQTMEWNYPSARPFCEQKSFIRQTHLYQIFRMMPKCSLLHIHNAAALSTDGFIELLQDWSESTGEDGVVVPEIYIVNKPGGKKIVGSLIYRPNVNSQDPGEQREAQAIMPFCESLRSFFQRPDSEFVLKNLISMTSVNRTEKVQYIWDEFNAIFIRTGDLFENSQFYYYYHYRAFKEMIEDNIEYVELRCGLTDFKDAPQSMLPWNLVDQDVPFLDMLKEAADNAIADWNQAHEKPEDKREFSIRVILSTRRDIDLIGDVTIDVERNNPGDKILLKMDAAIVIKKNSKYEDFIVGFDLVSEEDRGKKTYTLFSRGAYQKVGEGYRDPENIVDAADFIEAHDQFALPRIQLLDFYLHDGESIWADNDNMLDAAVTCRHRVGHGFNLCKSPRLIEQLYPRGNAGGAEQEKGINPTEPFLEICPISNQMLRYFPDLRAHSAYELMKNGVQCVLGNDDPMILDNPGLSYDFWETYIGMGVNLLTIKGLVFNAFICKKLADAEYPALEGQDEYVLDLNQMIGEFNNRYWAPFLEEAYDYLDNNHLL